MVWRCAQLRILIIGLIQVPARGAVGGTAQFGGRNPLAADPRENQMTIHICVAAFVALSSILPVAAQAEPPVPTREQLNGVLWMQKAVEYRSNAIQTYRLATARLDEATAQNTSTASVEQDALGGFQGKDPAVVLDVDETTLDNMAYNATLVATGTSWHPTTWSDWVKAGQAGEVPGAKDFILAARGKGYRVVFITDRNCIKSAGWDAQGRPIDCPQRKPTLENLARVLGYAVADGDLLMQWDKAGRNDDDKRARRAEIAATHRIAMLVGDNLNDFILGTEYKAAAHEDRWGKQWFMLANPVYGSWDAAFKKTDQKYAALKTWAGGPATLNVVTWNMAWLSDPAILDAKDYWNRCSAKGFDGTKLDVDLPYCNAYQKEKFKTAADYRDKKLAALRSRMLELAALKVDVFGFVETQSAEALKTVLPPGYSIKCFTTRPDPQNIGFAVRDGTDVATSCQEITSLSLEDTPNISHPVRRGLELTATVSGHSVTMLNVHLKASCPKVKMDSVSNDCKLLQLQAKPLEKWIEDQANAGRDFMIIGDWNRDLEAEVAGNFPARSDGSDATKEIQSPTLVRNLWPEINDKVPPASEMALAKMDRTATSGGCFGPLDQVVTSTSLLRALAAASLVDGKQPAALLARPVGSSDHCPVQIKLTW